VKKGRSLTSIIERCARLRCPVCGRASIVQSPFHIRLYCPSCDALFKREEGFFVGAIAVNVVTTELVILVSYLASLPLISSHYDTIITILLALAVVFPIAFYHHSWSIWLSLDHLVESLPKFAGQDHARLKGEGRR